MQVINWGAAVKAGIIAGLIFLILEMVLVATVGGDSPWAPPRMIGAIVLGEGVLPPPGTFHATAVVAALVVHFALAILYGAIFAFIVEKAGWSLGMSAVAGLAFAAGVAAAAATLVRP